MRYLERLNCSLSLINADSSVGSPTPGQERSCWGKSISFTLSYPRTVNCIMLNFPAVMMSLLKTLFCEKCLILTFESTHPVSPEVLERFVFSFGVIMTKIIFKTAQTKYHNTERTRQISCSTPLHTYFLGGIERIRRDAFLYGNRRVWSFVFWFWNSKKCTRFLCSEVKTSRGMLQYV